MQVPVGLLCFSRQTWHGVRGWGSLQQRWLPRDEGGGQEHGDIEWDFSGEPKEQGGLYGREKNEEEEGSGGGQGSPGSLQCSPIRYGVTLKSRKV